MTDEQALVERLRAAKWPVKIEGGRSTAWTATTDLCTEAADALVAQEARARKLVEALAFYADPSKAKDEYGDPVRIPDFYNELDFGETARAALAEGRGK